MRDGLLMSGRKASIWVRGGVVEGRGSGSWEHRGERCGFESVLVWVRMETVRMTWTAARTAYPTDLVSAGRRRLEKHAVGWVLEQ